MKIRGKMEMKRLGNGLYKFYLPDNRTNSSMDRLANALMGFSEIREVIISDASNGYLIKTRFFAGMEPKGKRMEQFVRRVNKL